MSVDEKWIIYDNVCRKRSWGKSSEPFQITSKEGLHPHNALLTLFWDIRRIFFYRASSTKGDCKLGFLLRTTAKINRGSTEKSGVALTQLSLTLHYSRRIFYYQHYIHI